ncbi:MAG TPA: ribonuclease P protein component [Marmoricola sp.]|nr:ribonuclease P protein component [Marmoricola sp.]
MTTSAQFRAAIRGARAGGPVVVLHLAPAEDQSTRVGFVVSKAVGNAVVRNQVKRRLRSIMAIRLAALPKGSHVVLRAQPGAASATFAELSAAVDRQWSRLGAAA